MKVAFLFSLHISLIAEHHSLNLHFQAQISSHASPMCLNVDVTLVTVHTKSKLILRGAKNKVLIVRQEKQNFTTNTLARVDRHEL